MARRAPRFDPGRCEANCPVCGQIVGSQPGEQTTSHQKPDSRETCPGGTTQ